MFKSFRERRSHASADVAEEDRISMASYGLVASCFPWVAKKKLNREQKKQEKQKLVEQLQYHEIEMKRLRTEMEELEQDNNELQCELSSCTSCIKDTCSQLEYANKDLRESFNTLKKVHECFIFPDSKHQEAEDKLFIQDDSVESVDPGHKLPHLMTNLLSLVEEMKYFSESVMQRTFSRSFADPDESAFGAEPLSERAWSELFGDEISLSELLTTRKSLATTLCNTTSDVGIQVDLGSAMKGAKKSRSAPNLFREEMRASNKQHPRQGHSELLATTTPVCEIHTPQSVGDNIIPKSVPKSSDTPV